MIPLKLVDPVPLVLTSKIRLANLDSASLRSESLSARHVMGQDAVDPLVVAFAVGVPARVGSLALDAAVQVMSRMVVKLQHCRTKREAWEAVAFCGIGAWAGPNICVKLTAAPVEIARL